MRCWRKIQCASWTLEEEQNTADRLKDDIEEEKQTLMRIL